MFPLHFLGPHSSVRTAAPAFCYLGPVHYNSRSGLARICGRRFDFGPCIASPAVAFLMPPPVRLRTFGGVASDAIEKCTEEKPSVCTADELHYVSVPNSDWRLALWRYRPPPNAQPRNHPLLLLSGVATNAIGYDLSPESSFARYMSRQGFDTWILEVRGAGLSTQRSESREVKQPVNVMSGKSDSAYNRGTNGIHFAETLPGMNFTFDAFRESKISSGEGKRTETVTRPVELQLVTKLMDTVALLSEKLSGFLDEGVFTIKQNSAVTSQIRDLSQRLINTIKSQRSVSPQYFDLADHLSTTIVTIEDFQKQIDLIVKYDWDFDHHLEEDVPTAMDYIRAECKPKDDKLLAIGHSMGGILLYAMISRHGFNAKDSGLASVVTLASSLDYTTSRSSLKYLLPVVDPAQALNVPVMPLGAIFAAAFPFACRPPYVMSWLNPQISAENMMHPELFEKLVLNNFGTVPTKLLVQLTTAFRGGGLCDRSGTFFYKDHLRRSNVPVLALAGDQDLICPPEAVYETIKLIPEHLIKYKVFGEPGGPHYAHYDLVGSRLAASQVYPCIIEFLSHHDMN